MKRIAVLGAAIGLAIPCLILFGQPTDYPIRIPSLVGDARADIILKADGTVIINNEEYKRPEADLKSIDEPSCEHDCARSIPRPVLPTEKELENEA